jgi:hypothetical protein
MLTGSCLECDSGTWSGELGLSICGACESGSYSRKEDGFGATVCLDCDAGTATLFTNTIQCTQCKAGYHASNNGSKECVAWYDSTTTI